MGHIRLDTSEYPVVVTEMVGNFSVDQARAYCDELQELAKRGQRVGSVTDLTHASIPDLKVRSVLRKFTETNQQLSDRTTICSAIVVDSAAMKMIVSAIYLVVRTAYPQKAFRTREIALEWVRQQVQSQSAA